jgi:hypothetical protein
LVNHGIVDNFLGTLILKLFLFSHRLN